MREVGKFFSAKERTKCIKEKILNFTKLLLKYVRQLSWKISSSAPSEEGAWFSIRATKKL